MLPNALVRSRVERVTSASRNALTWPRLYTLCQRSATHFLRVAGLVEIESTPRGIGKPWFQIIGSYGLHDPKGSNNV